MRAKPMRELMLRHRHVPAKCLTPLSFLCLVDIKQPISTLIFCCRISASYWQTQRKFKQEFRQFWSIPKMAKVELISTVDANLDNYRNRAYYRFMKSFQ